MKKIIEHIGFVALSFLVFSSSAISKENTRGLEIAPSLSFYSGDALRASLLYGSGILYRFNQSFWMGGDFYAGHLKTDQGNGLQLKTKESFFLWDAAFYWNLPALLGSSTKTSDGLKADFYTSAGVGQMFFGSKVEPTGFIGGGMTLHTGWHRLFVRFDLKNYFFVLRNSAGSNFNSDMLLSIGPSLLF